MEISRRRIFHPQIARLRGWLGEKVVREQRKLNSKREGAQNHTTHRIKISVGKVSSTRMVRKRYGLILSKGAGSCSLSHCFLYRHTPHLRQSKSLTKQSPLNGEERERQWRDRYWKVPLSSIRCKGGLKWIERESISRCSRKRGESRLSRDGGGVPLLWRGSRAMKFDSPFPSQLN